MNTAADSLLILGCILAASIFADAVARRTRLPRISLLILVGVLAAVSQYAVTGQSGMRPLGDLGEPLIEMALIMVAFLLGGELTGQRLRAAGALILGLSASVLVVSVSVVGLGLTAMGYPLGVAVSLAAISVATDPAAVLEAIREGRSDGTTARVLKGVVAIDDAWGIVVFGLAMAFLGWGAADGGVTALLHAAWELGGALLLGVALGVPAAWLTGRLDPGRPTQAEALALILLMGGLAGTLGVSGLLMAMVCGCVIVNLSRHHQRAFHEIENIEWPFLVFFFVLAGASIDPAALATGVGLTSAYIVLRLAGRYLGGQVVARGIRRRSARLPGHVGLALTPQAGVAMGMALLAAERVPDHAALIMAAAVTSTVIFELSGPLLVAWVLRSSPPASSQC